MFITSFGADNDNDNDNEKDIQDILPKYNNNNKNGSGKAVLPSTVNKNEKSIANLKQIKQNATLSMLRSTQSRSRSRSPPLAPPSFNKFVFLLFDYFFLRLKFKIMKF